MPADFVHDNARAPESLQDSILRHVRYTLARPCGNPGSSTAAWGESPSPRELLKPVSLAIRDRLIDRLLETEQRYREQGAKRLYYLSLEFLMGRWLSDNLANLRLEDECRAVLAELHIRLEDVLEAEPDAGLGNGGLGRLAACFLESLATM